MLLPFEARSSRGNKWCVSGEDRCKEQQKGRKRSTVEAGQSDHCLIIPCFVQLTPRTRRWILKTTSRNFPLLYLPLRAVQRIKNGKIAKMSSPGHLVNNNITLTKMTLIISYKISPLSFGTHLILSRHSPGASNF